MGLVPVFNRGDHFGDLEIHRKIGSGAFGTVYLARDRLIDRDVALKIIPAGIDERDEQRALREARAVGRLANPHIATLYRVHSSDELGAWLFEMEYVAGGSLAQRIADGATIEVDEVLRIARAVADALAHAHGRDVIHGDIKPGNVLIADDGQVKLVDFGLARLMGDVSLKLSTSDHPGGTPLYMAPEVIMNDEPAPTTDVWSFGVLLYRLIEGCPPFVGRGMGGLVHSILNDDAPPMGDATPTGVRELVGHCLEKDESLRPASGQELAAALERLATAPAPAATPIVPPALTRTRNRRYGQDTLLRRVRPIIEGLSNGRGSVLAISGEAGAGKTTLLRTVRDQARAIGAQWVECAVSKLQGFQRPLLVALREAIGVQPEAGPMVDVSASTRRLIETLYGDDPSVPVQDELQLYWVVEQVIRSLARRGPLCLAVEDAHISDEQDERLLRHLAHYLSQEGVLLAVTCRTDETQSRAEPVLDRLLDVAETHHVALEALRDSDVCALVEDQFESSRVDTAILDRIAKLSQGNPMLCAELARHLRETGAVLVHAGSVKPGPAWETASLPRRLRDLAAARLATLTDEERELLDIAAVDGLEFDARALAAVREERELQVMRCLQRVARKRGIVRPTATGYRFAGTAMQEVIYLDLASEMRRALHRALAEHLESRTESISPIRIGTHWERADERDRARPYLRAATKEAVGRFEWSRATALAERADLAPDQLDAATAIERADLLLKLAPAYRGAGRVDECVALLEVVAEAARAVGEDRVALRAMVGLQDALYYHRGRDAVDTSLLQRAARELAPSESAAQALELLGVIAKFGQQYDDAERYLREAHRIAQELDLEFRVARAQNELASIAMRRGKLREAEALYADSARVAEHAGHRVNAAVSRVNGAIASFSRGELDGVAERIERSIREMSFDGAPNSSGQTQIVLGNVLWAEGRPDEALRATETGLAVLEQTKHLPGLTTGLRLKAEILGCAGHLEEAWSLYRRAHDLLLQVDNRRIERTIHALAMRFHLWAGDLERAAEAAGPCLEQLRVDPGEAARIAVDLGEGILFGLPDELLDELQAAVHEARDDTPEMDSARAFFDLAYEDRRGNPPARDAVRRFLSMPLAYCRKLTHTHAQLLVGADDAAGWRALRQTARGMGHVWLELACLERWASAAPDSEAETALSQLRERISPDRPRR